MDPEHRAVVAIAHTNEKHRSWDTALRKDNGHVNPLGLYDLDCKIRPVGRTYQRLIQQWQDTPLLCLFPSLDRPTF